MRLLRSIDISIWTRVCNLCNALMRPPLNNLPPAFPLVVNDSSISESRSVVRLIKSLADVGAMKIDINAVHSAFFCGMGHVNRYILFVEFFNKRTYFTHVMYSTMGLYASLHIPHRLSPVCRPCATADLLAVSHRVVSIYPFFFKKKKKLKSLPPLSNIHQFVTSHFDKV
jgi:hypothetical protein